MRNGGMNAFRSWTRTEPASRLTMPGIGAYPTTATPVVFRREVNACTLPACEADQMTQVPRRIARPERRTGNDGHEGCGDFRKEHS
jgi:hypothetical protein